MAYTTIDNPALFFQTVIYTGNGSDDRDITLPGDKDMQPDLVWLKSRDTNNYNHFWTDSVRGATKYMKSDANSAENTLSGSVKAFNSDGFRVGTEADVNNNTTTYVAWCWKAGGSASSNSDGSITSSVSANTTAGFSIVSWTGTGSAATIGHGLGAVPTMIMVKNRDQTDDWYCYNVHNGNTHSILLNSTGAKVGAYTDNWNNTTPTSSVFSVGGSHATSGGSSEKMIAYCFTDIKGYSKLGSYVGTGSDVFVHTGFNVGWLLIKNASDTNGWLIIDTKRSPANPQGKYIYANANSAEGTVTYGEFFSNGFGWKGTSSVAVNQSGNTFIYYAIAESPFVNSNGVQTNAR